MTIFLMVAIAFTAKKNDYQPERPHREPVGTVVRAGFKSIWALLFPVILIAGLRFGFFTPSEAGAFAVAYGIVIGLLIYRELTWKGFKRALSHTVSDVGMIMILITLSGSWAYGLAWDRIPQQLMGFLLGITENPTAIMFILVVALIIAGMFMDSTVLILLLTTMLVPVAGAAGIDPIHFGIVMVLTLTFGLLTPPIGIVMLIVCSFFKTNIPAYFRQSAYLFVAMAGLLILIILVPEISLWLPNLIYGP